MWSLLTVTLASNRGWTNLKLFQDPVSSTGFIILAIFGAALVIWIGVACVCHLREKHFERLPGIIGQPRQLLEDLAPTVDLTTSERYVLARIAYRMKLPQPASILISPPLLVRSARTWLRTHHFKQTKRWGVRLFDQLAQKVHGQTLVELADQLDVSSPGP